MIWLGLSLRIFQKHTIYPYPSNSIRLPDLLFRTILHTHLLSHSRTHTPDRSHSEPATPASLGPNNPTITTLTMPTTMPPPQTTTPTMTTLNITINLTPNYAVLPISTRRVVDGGVRGWHSLPVRTIIIPRGIGVDLRSSFCAFGVLVVSK